LRGCTKPALCTENKRTSRIALFYAGMLNYSNFLKRRRIGIKKPLKRGKMDMFTPVKER